MRTRAGLRTRCAARRMVHGAARDALAHARSVARDRAERRDRTIRSVFDARGRAESARRRRLRGNFHGQPVSAALDYLAIAITSLASICERRIDRLVNPYLSELPAFLAEQVGLNSGFMLAQVTAAALVSGEQGLRSSRQRRLHPHLRRTRRTTSRWGRSRARKAAAAVANARRVARDRAARRGPGPRLPRPLRPARVAVAAAPGAIRPAGAAPLDATASSRATSSDRPRSSTRGDPARRRERRGTDRLMTAAANLAVRQRGTIPLRLSAVRGDSREHDPHRSARRAAPPSPARDGSRRRPSVCS